MTERERWIVYPLLFLALGASMRDKFTKPAEFEATKLECDELRAHRVVIVDPLQDRPRLKLGTLTEAIAQSTGSTPNIAGQIEVLDSSQRVQTAITGGAVHTQALLSRGMVVVDPIGRPRVEIVTKVEHAGDAKNPPLTRGVLDIVGSDNVPAVLLSSTPEGGVVVARHARVPTAVVIGNTPSGSGVYLQGGAGSILLTRPYTSQEIKALENTQPKEPAKTPAVGHPSQPPTKRDNGVPAGQGTTP